MDEQLCVQASSQPQQLLLLWCLRTQHHSPSPPPSLPSYLSPSLAHRQRSSRSQPLASLSPAPSQPCLLKLNMFNQPSCVSNVYNEWLLKILTCLVVTGTQASQSEIDAASFCEGECDATIAADEETSDSSTSGKIIKGQNLRGSPHSCKGS